MSTQHLKTRPETEPQPNRNRTATRTRTTQPERTIAEAAPKTFSHRDTAQLQNLIDEFNAAFAGGESEPASGS